MTDIELKQASMRILNEFAQCDSTEVVMGLIEKSIGDFMLLSVLPNLTHPEKTMIHKEFLNRICTHILEDLEGFHKGSKLHPWKMPEDTEI